MLPYNKMKQLPLVLDGPQMPAATYTSARFKVYHC